jgi:hypothetical protein
MKRRDVCATLAVGGAGLVQEIARGGQAAHGDHSPGDAKAPLDAASSWKPRFLSAADAETVATIAELILPATDTPGARAARVHEHIDLVLSEEAPAVQRAFLTGLRWIDRRSRRLFGAEFTRLDPERQTALLTPLAEPGRRAAADARGGRFFDDIKRRTVFAYYTSEIGIHQELRYQGNAYLKEWPGCPHPGHHGDPS